MSISLARRGAVASARRRTNITVPGAPTIGTATAGVTSASVTFTAPGSNGGAAIDVYRVTSSLGPTTTGASSPITISGLATSAQTFTVAAHNSVGYGLESAASNSVTPTATSTFVTRSGSNLMANGSKVQFTGYNNYVMTDCGTAQEMLNDAQRDAFFAGLRPKSVVRCWAFQGYTLTNLDKIVASAALHNQWLVMTLTDEFGNCGDGLGAKNATFYATGYTGGYFAWIDTIVPRFSSSTALLAWELVNEPSSGANNTDLKNMFDASAARIRTHDTNHLISTGTQPAWAYGDQAGYQLIHSGPNIDICSMHEYDEQSSASGHLTDVLTSAQNLNKPIFVGEYGIKATDSGGCAYTFAQRAAAYTAKLADYLSHPEVGGCCAWSYSMNHHTSCDLGIFDGDPTMTAIHDVAIP